MKGRSDDFTLGLTVIVIVALGLGSFFYITQSSFMAEATRTIEVHFTLEQGSAPLKPGSPVMLRNAVQVGEVEDVYVTRRLGGERLHVPIIVVRAEVDEDVTLYKGCEITTSEPVIGGSGYMVIQDVGDPNAGPVLENEPIQGQRPLSLAAAIGDLSDFLLGDEGFLVKLDREFDKSVEGSLMFKVATSLNDINAMTGELRHQLTPGEQQALLYKLHETMDNVTAISVALREETDAARRESLLAGLHAALAKLDSSLAEAQGMLTDARPVVQDTLTTVQGMARGLDEDVMSVLRAEFDREDPDALLAKVHEGLALLRGSLENVEVATDTGVRLLVTNRAALDRTVSNLRDASRELRDGIAELRLQPWRLLSPPTDVEKDRIVVFEAARQFALAAARLDDVSTRLEAMLAATPPGERTAATQEEIEQLQAALEAAFEQFQAAEHYFFEHIQEPR